MNEESQKFYQQQWNRPLPRFLKRMLPIIFAACLVFAIMLVTFYCIAFVFIQPGEEPMILSYITIAICLSVIIALSMDSWAMRRQSKFQPIRIRVREKTLPPEEQ